MIRAAILFSAVAVVLAPIPPARAAAGAAVVERFAGDPLAGRSDLPFSAEGAVSSRFTFLGNEGPHFPGDRPGTLRVLYDTTLPTARIAAPIGDVLSLDRDFAFGAILTIRSSGFFADPNGFSQIAFGLWNARTTGLDRTSFPSDAYDLVEADYFANVTEFGGPFLAPSVFGGNSGGNAFFNFAFQSAEVGLPLDVPILLQGSFAAATRRLTLSASRYAGGLVFVPIPGALVRLDLSTLRPAFLVDAIGIAAYGEGWPSLHAEVDYDLLWTGPVPPPFGVGTRTARGLRQPRATAPAR